MLLFAQCQHSGSPGRQRKVSTPLPTVQSHEEGSLAVGGQGPWTEAGGCGSRGTKGGLLVGNSGDLPHRSAEDHNPGMRDTKKQSVRSNRCWSDLKIQSKFKVIFGLLVKLYHKKINTDESMIILR